MKEHKFDLVADMIAHALYTKTPPGLPDKTIRHIANTIAWQALETYKRSCENAIKRREKMAVFHAEDHLKRVARAAARETARKLRPSATVCDIKNMRVPRPGKA